MIGYWSCWCIVKGVPLWVCGRKLHLQQLGNLEWCHVHFSRDLYYTFTRRIIWPDKNSMELFLTWNLTFNPHEIVTGLPLTRKLRFVRPLPGTLKLTSVWSMYFGTERIGLLTTGTRVLGWCDINETIISINNSKSFDGLPIIIPLMHINSVDIMRTFLDYIKNKLCKVCMQLKTNKQIWGNEQFNYLIFSNTHWCSFSNRSVCSELDESATRRVVLLQL